MDLEQWIKDEHAAIGPLFDMNVLNMVPRDKLTVKPASNSNSIAWLVWHLARCEDIIVNTVIRGGPQVLRRVDWRRELGVDDERIGTGLRDEEVVDFGERVNVDALLDYWRQVRAETASWLDGGAPLEAFDEVPNLHERLASVPAIVPQEGTWVLPLWGRKPVSFLFRWVVIGHGYVHLGEMQAVRGQLGIRGI